MRSIKMMRVPQALLRPGQMPFDKAEVIDFFEGYPSVFGCSQTICMATMSSERTYHHLGDYPMPEWLKDREVLIYANQHFRGENWLWLYHELPSSQTRGWDSPTFGVELFSCEEVERLLATGYPPEGIYWLFN